MRNMGRLIAGGSQAHRAQLLELRTETGAVYLFPSWWQRIRLGWTFRHFHVLPPQVLSRRDRRLIEKLSRSAIVKPTLPVASNTVFGVVEKVGSKPLAAAHPAAALRMEPGMEPSSPQVSWANSALSGFPIRRWGAWGALLAVCATVIVISLFPTRRQRKSPQRVSAPIRQAANEIKPLNPNAPPTGPLPVSPAPAHLPKAPRPAQVAAPPPVEPVVASQNTLPPPAASAHAPSPASERLFVSELPQGHFAYPVVSQRGLIGELQLRALVGADGSVKDVTVLSGNPQLAEAGMRAVRQWRFSPYQGSGGPIEVETRIKMSFFGQDAVSIASVADKPTSIHQ